MVGYIYFIRDELGHIKIGIAKNIKKRFDTIQTYNPMRLEVYRTLEIENMQIASKLEKILHTKFKEYRLQGEWFEEGPIIKFLNQSSFMIGEYEFESSSKENIICMPLIGVNKAMKKGYNLREVSELLGIKLRTVREWVRNGKIHANKITGTNRWIVMESEIRRLQNANKDREYSE